MSFLVQSKSVQDNVPTLTLTPGPCDKLAFPPAYVNERVDETISNAPAVYAAKWNMSTWWQAKFTVTVDRGKSQVNEYVGQGKEYIERGRATVEQVVTQGRGFVQQQADKVAAAVDAGKQAYQTTTAVEPPSNGTGA